MSFLNPSMRCGDQINEALRIKNKNQVFDLIKKVKIENYEETYDKYPHELSGGQQQRIMIAMAIAKNPQLIIADEATSSLDSLIKKNIIDLLLELKKGANKFAPLDFRGIVLTPLSPKKCLESLCQ